MRPPMPRPPQNGQRLPPKPTNAEKDALLHAMRKDIAAADLQIAHLSRMIVLMLSGSWRERLAYALSILFKRPMFFSRARLKEVSATQLWADNHGEDFYKIGADDGKPVPS